MGSTAGLLCADVLDVLEDVVEHQPDTVAVEFEGDELTYGGVDSAANQVAGILRERGVMPGEPVVMCVEPGPLTAVAVVGILKAGGAYVPVLASDPVERISYVRADAGARFLVTEARHLSHMGHVVADPIVLDRLGDMVNTSVDRTVSPHQLAYVLYTSGSSGRPKGVAVTHESLRYYLGWHLGHLRPAAGDLDLPLSSSLCFAAGVTQFYTPLLLARTQRVLSRDTMREPERVLDWYEANPEYGLYCVPTLWSSLLSVAERRVAAGERPPGPRGVLLSGEAVSATLVDRSLEVWPALQLWNLYGPTETVANASAGKLRRGRTPTIGAPIEGTRIFLADGSMREVASGETGEICICGPGVASGYINLPELTQERFTSNPFDPSDPQRVFRTGDLAYYDEYGELVFVGRRDFQVKVRGHRVECGEIEQALQLHVAVREAVVVARTTDVPMCAEPGHQLVAYVTFHVARYASVHELRDFLAASLPDYMMPAAFVVLDALPRLANGKADRRRLPAPGRARPELGYAFEPPRTMREAQLVTLWEEVLGLTGLGTTDDFFELGGDSLQVADVIARIRATLHLSPSYRMVFDHPSPASLAAALSCEERARAPEPLARAPVSAAYPCAENQRAVWLLTETFPGLSAYNMQFSLALDGKLDEPALAGALRDTLERHHVLRAVISAEEGRPAMTVLPPADPALNIVDLRQLGSGRLEVELAELCRHDRERPFALARGPLLRSVLYRLGDDRHRLTVTVHHLVFDGRSIGIFCRDLLERYRARRAGSRLPTSPSDPQYEDWCAAERESPDVGDRRELVEFWGETLDGCPTVLDIPPDYLRPPVRRFEGGSRTVRIGPELKAAITELARGAQATPFMAMFAAFNVLLHRWSGQDDILVGCPVANRGRPGADELIGFLANTIVLRTRVSDEQSFEDLLATTREHCLAVLDHQEVSFDTLLDVARPDRSLGQAPIFQVMFGFHEQPFSEQADGLVARACDEGTGGAKYDLTVDVLEDGDEWDLRLTYRTDLYAERTIARWLDQYVRLLRAIAESPASVIGDHGLISDGDRERLARWNATARDNERRRGLHRLFEDQTQRTPARTALVDGRRRLSYATLDGRANHLARKLIDLGVEEGALVGVHVEPSADMVITLLAVLKAGAAYVPLDPHYPPGRIADAVEDSGLGVIVAQPHLVPRLAGGGTTVVTLDADQLDIAGDSPAPLPRRDPDPRGLMYVMYTSGSTGRPKGVMVPHEGAANYVLWMRDRFAMSAADTVLSKTSINFDISVWEIFLPLICGARLVIGRPEDLQAPDALAALIARERITTIQFVASALRAFVDAGRLPDCDSLTRIFSGGEALPARLEEEVLASSAAELHNLYGPTEASIYATHWPCRAERRRSVPIGHPVHNTAIHILDARMRPVPVGTAGDLYIGGVGVAAGYLGQPDLTATAFPPDPFSAEEGARLFSTNDRARFRDDGAIEFLGRSDAQVKVRGYRIELDEVAYHLNAHPTVRHAIVIVREDQVDDVRLVAYLLYEDPSGPGDDELRRYLKQKLPDHMIPAAFVALDSIPLLPNSKADISALPRPAYAKTLSTELRRAFADDRERALAEIWEQVLGTPRFGPEDSFFDVGGHSLLIARLAALIKERLGVEVSNVELFQFPTIRSLAGRVGNGDHSANGVAAEMARRAARRDGRRHVARPAMEEGRR